MDECDARLPATPRRRRLVPATAGLVGGWFGSVGQAAGDGQCPCPRDTEQQDEREGRGTAAFRPSQPSAGARRTTTGGPP